MNRSVAGLLLPLLLLAAACSRTEAAPNPPDPFADCSTLTAPPVPGPAGLGLVPSAPSPKPTAPTQPVPAVALPCFTGGAEVALADLRGPAVVNLWATWCLPCRKELPAFQRLADRTDGLHVIGVDTVDKRDDGRDLGIELGLTFPTLFDPERKLSTELAVGPGLPLTLFIDADGQIRYLHTSGALDDAALTALVEQHLGVVAPA